MQNFKDRWEIKSNWQLVFPVLGILSLIFSSFLISKSIAKRIVLGDDSAIAFFIVTGITILLSLLFLYITLKLFSVLEKKWDVNYRWELIAIFIVFAITGSTSAKISDPIISFLGLDRSTTSGWIYWPIRIFLVFPVYQILLLIVGWVFGQFKFFWNFEKKMLGRMGFARFFR